MFRKTDLFLLLLLSVVPGFFAGDDTSSHPPRPKVGLALSGGGARGCAHIGVIRVLEELNVPIDYIAGTSMGAVVGGLYAAGLSTDEMTVLLKDTDWDEAILDVPSRRNLAFRRKQEEQRYLLDFEAGLSGFDLKLPTGLRDGQKLLQLLRTHSLKAAGANCFDDLTVPFRAVATDLETGRAVVLEDGDLARAIRASMAIPGVFSPVELNGRLLADGGMALNLPVEVVRSMGADIVIAVDISEPLYGREGLNSFLGISYQAMSMLTRKNVEEQIPLADLVIIPDLGSTGTLDFSRVEQLIQAGREEALKHLEALSLLQTSEPPSIPVYPGLEGDETIAAIRFDGLERVDKRQVAGVMDLAPGDPFDFDTLFMDLERIYGLGHFQLVDYALQPGDGEVELVMHGQEKPWGPNYLHFNAGLETDANEDVLFGALINLTNTQLNALGAEWKTDLLLGDNTALISEVYQPLDFRGAKFLSTTARLRRDKLSIQDDDLELAELDHDQVVLAVDFGRQFREFGVLRLGLEAGGGDLDLVEGSLDLLPETPLESFQIGQARLTLALDRLDSVTYPTKGYILNFGARYSDEALGADFDFRTLEIRFNRFFTRKRNTWITALDAGSSLDTELPLHEAFVLGGFGRLSGYRSNGIRGNHYALARLGLTRTLYRLPNLGRLFAGGLLEAGREWQDSDVIDTNDLRSSYTLLVGADTILGPVYLAGAMNDNQDFNYYLIMGTTLFSR